MWLFIIYRLILAAVLVGLLQSGRLSPNAERSKRPVLGLRRLRRLALRRSISELH